MKNFQLPSTWDVLLLGCLVAFAREGFSLGWGGAQPAARPCHCCRMEPPAPRTPTASLANPAESELMGQPSPFEHDLMA